MKQNKTLTLVMMMSAMVIFTVPTYAMHIMEGFLPVTHCAIWFAISAPFVVGGVFQIKKIVKQNRKAMLLLAMMGAFAFVLSALKIPSVTGSSSHPTGTGLGAVLFGPMVMAVIGLIVLLFQAILLAHGGLTTLGANTFSMAIAGPFASYGVYKLCKKTKLSKPWSVGIACAVGNLVTYCVTSVQLGVAHPSATGGAMESIIKFMSVFAVTQIPLAIIEGILSAIVVMMLSSVAKPELESIEF